MTKHKILFWLYFLIFSLLIGPPPGWAAKPRPPLQLSLLQAPLSENQSRLILSATANFDLTEVALSLDLSADLALIEGSGTWTGPLRKGETQKVEVVVQSPDRAEREVVGKAAIRLAEGETFLQKSVLTLNKPKSKSTPPPVKRKEGGEEILEFKGR